MKKNEKDCHVLKTGLAMTLVCLFLFPVAVSFSAQSTASAQSVSKAQSILISSIKMEGFVLQNKNQFVELFKPYRNKYLTTADMNEILQKIQDIYAMGGYQQLVSITYHVDKHLLVFTASMTS